MSTLQASWDRRAAANFMLGGAGAGLIMVCVLTGMESRLLAFFVGLILIAAGLGAVWLEIGRKLRAVHVFFNPFTSWMTRESFAALTLFVLGVAYLAVREPAFLYGASAVAAVFLWCQARILRAAKGIPAWRAPEIVPLIVTTGLAEGAGLALFFSDDAALLAICASAVVARHVAWTHYRKAVPGEALKTAALLLLWMGTAAALVLLALAGRVGEAAPLAGLAALVPGARLKLALVTRASLQQGFSLPHLPVRGTR